MTQRELLVDRAKTEVEQAARHPWIERLARWGFATKGIVYLLIGGLAALAAAGVGGETTDQNGVLQRIAALPLGSVLLGLVALGLIGYAVWRLIEAVLGTGDTKIGKRIGYGISAIIYGGLAFGAIRTLLGARQPGDGAQDWTARLLGAPMGRWLVALVGLAIVGFGAYQIYKGVTEDLRSTLGFGRLNQSQQQWAIRSGRFGLIARGIVLGIVGLLVMQAGFRADASRANGIDGALQVLEGQSYGPALLGVVALGLAAYGAWMLVCARYGRLEQA